MRRDTPARFVYAMILARDAERRRCLPPQPPMPRFAAADAATRAAYDIERQMLMARCA